MGSNWRTLKLLVHLAKQDRWMHAVTWDVSETAGHPKIHFGGNRIDEDGQLWRYDYGYDYSRRDPCYLRQETIPFTGAIEAFIDSDEDVPRARVGTRLVALFDDGRCLAISVYRPDSNEARRIYKASSRAANKKREASSDQ